MESYRDRIMHLAEDADAAVLIKELQSVVHDAQIELSDANILALLSLRKERAILSAIEDFILSGKVEARLAPDAPHKTGLPLNQVRYYVFTKVSDKIASWSRWQMIRTWKPTAPEK